MTEMTVEKEIAQKVQLWLDSNIDTESKGEIQSLLNNPGELTERFYKDLEFGTGGLRGIMGVGSNRMNKYTVGMATQGLANYLLKTYPHEQIKVAIAHDSRNNSRFFAETVAAVFSANGIMVYLFEELRPTPQLSFAIRHLGCHSGVVLTASHNPKEYNGYKAYWNDGAQLVEPHDNNVIEEVSQINSIDDVSFEANNDLIQLIGKEIDEAYLNQLTKLSLSPEIIAEQKDLKIVFSPIHGTGITLVPECLKRFGFENVIVVEKQAQPDGNFSTVEYPNPEEAEAMKLAVQLAEAKNADLVMATDPDADRVGIAVKNPNGKFQLLNGNQTGSLLLYYILKQWDERKLYAGNEYIVKTIVTSDLMDRIAEHFNVECFNTLTGFKHIAALIRELEGKKRFIAGGEESYGYMIGDFVRDKDAVASCAVIAEMCAYAKSNGQTLYEMMIEMYETLGLYQEKLISITKKGKKGSEEIAEMMSQFRNEPPDSFAGSKVVKLIDYQSGMEKDLVANTSKQINFPSSNVLQFITEDNFKVSARPSGTEPKIKFYISVNKKIKQKGQYWSTQEELNKIIANIEKDLKVGN